jgi:hypothetical protein
MARKEKDQWDATGEHLICLLCCVRFGAACTTVPVACCYVHTRCCTLLRWVKFGELILLTVPASASYSAVRSGAQRRASRAQPRASLRPAAAAGQQRRRARVLPQARALGDRRQVSRLRTLCRYSLRIRTYHDYSLLYQSYAGLKMGRSPPRRCSGSTSPACCNCCSAPPTIRLCPR